MKISADGVWYFSRDGQQSGPLTYADLKEKADAGALKPRFDLVWKEGMTDWAPVGEVDGLFERHETAAPPEADPYASPPSTIGDPYHGEAEGTWPGARRRSYLFFCLVFPFLLGFVVGLVKTASPELLGPQMWKYVDLYGLMVFPSILGLYFGIQRFANLGMSRWWYLGHFVPFLNLWTGYRSFACPAGYAVHKKMDGAGIFLAIIYWLVVVAFIATIAFLIAILFGAAGSPEIQQQLNDALEQLMTQTQAAAK
ncbi:MAG: DUF4339 domain-containing protein [Verrucomicrobiaceae bacterium]|nr:MAG: DUF4339 domain-containing protein [Verrucomicrobiaceae bacterium]